MALSFHASSRIVEEDNPSLALTLFPLNAEATVRLVEKQLDGHFSSEDLSTIKARLDEAIALNAGHARLQSLRSEVALRLGDPISAAEGFQHALRLSKTESVALQRMIAWSSEQQDVEDVLRNTDLLLRRHPGKISELGGILAALIGTEEGYEQVKERLRLAPPWRSATFRQIASNPANLSAGASLLVDLREAGSPPSDGEVSTIIQALIREGRALEAYNLFLGTQSDEEVALSGYIHDAGFEGSSSSKPFDWQIRSRSGHTISRLPQAVFGSEPTGLLIQFNGTPVKDMHVRQMLHLPPGALELTAEVSAANAKLPKGLYWSLRCTSPARELARLDIPEGSYRNEAISVRLDVPAIDCPLQVISLHTAVIAESWKDRYMGNVVIRRLQMRKGSS